MDSDALSVVMAERLKALRIGSGQEGKPDYSHNKLKDALAQRYGGGKEIISKDSLQKYESTEPKNTKSRANNGMKVEYLRYFADFYGVSADYLLGLSEVATRNETIQGINEKTGLWEDAISRLMTEKTCGDDEISDFISYLVVNPRISELISAVKGKNRFAADPKPVTISLDNEAYSADMQDLFKMIVGDLFFEIIDGYTAKPGEIMVGYKVGENDG